MIWMKLPLIQDCVWSFECIVDFELFDFELSKDIKFNAAKYKIIGEDILIHASTDQSATAIKIRNQRFHLVLCYHRYINVLVEVYGIEFVHYTHHLPGDLLNLLTVARAL